MSGKFQGFQDKFATMSAPTVAAPKAAAPEGLSTMERQQLSALCSQPGFAALEKLLEYEAERFTSQLLDTKSAQASDVLAAHTRAQVAWEIVSHLLRQIHYEIGEATSDAEALDDVIDPTSDPLGDIL